MGASTTNYIRAKEVIQRSHQPKPQQADVWVSGRAEDDNGITFVSVEVKPAFGNVAAVRLSLVELQALADLILGRLELPNEAALLAPVEVTVAEGTKVRINYA